jgi:uncharacterized protein (DUF433 family)
MKLPIVLIPHPHVRVDELVLAGSPYVVGSRVPVRRLWAFYRSGAPIERIFKRYPQLGPAKILDALAFAYDNEEVVEADLARENEILTRAGHRAARPKAGIDQMELPFANPAAPMPTTKKR